MNRNIVITGGAGFIGSHLCELLVKEDNIYSIDNYSSGSEENHINGVTYIRGDTENISELISIKPDLVFHLGEFSRVEQSFDNIDLIIKSNIRGTIAVLEFCRKFNCKLVYAGSSTKFADNGEGKNQSPYSWSKSSNTELVVNYGSWFNLPYAITYFYNAYGPREIKTGKYATLIAIFSENYKNNKPLTIVRPGTQRRNFTHVSDIVSGLELVGRKGYGDGFGIGNHISFSVQEVAEMFGDNIEYLPPRRGNRLSGEVVTDKTIELGWKPSIYLTDYINDLKKRHKGDL